MTTELPEGTGKKSDQTTASTSTGILGIALILLVVALCVNPVPESDLFWQLRTGEWIVSNHAAPHADLYSWTRPGTPWIAHEWLSFAVLWQCFHLAGFGGLYLLTAAAVATIFGLHFAFINRETRSPLLTFLLCAGCAVVASPFFQPRPQLATYLFSLITLHILLEFRSGAATAKRLALLVPMFVVWANLHAGMLIGLALIGIFAIGEVVSSVVDRNRRLWPALLATAVACFAATLITPYSYHVYANILSTISNSTAMSIVAEWASPDFHQEYGKQIELLIAAIVYGMFFTRLRREPADALLLLVLVHEALSANRNGPLLAILGVTVAAKHIHSAINWHLFRADTAPATSLAGSTPPGTIALVLAAAFVLFGFANASRSVRAFGGSTGSTLHRIGQTIVVYWTYPEAACDFIRREQFPSTMHMFNSYDDGGFLAWRMPERPVFIDSRADVYFGHVLEDYRKVNSLKYGWDAILTRYGADMIVVSVSNRQVRQYLSSTDWALVYVDDADLSTNKEDEGKRNTAIFVKRQAIYGELIERCRRDCPAYPNVARNYTQWASVK